MQNKRSAFTMIELIFVIVILGILAAVSIPKIAATRNDASAASIAMSIATCVNDSGGAYIMSGIFDYTGSACLDAISSSCYTVATDATTDNILVVTGIPTADTSSVCFKAVALSDKNGLSNGTVAVNHRF